MSALEISLVLSMAYGNVLNGDYIGLYSLIWVAVKELNLNYYIGETLLTTIFIHTHYGNFFKFLNSKPVLLY